VAAALHFQVSSRPSTALRRLKSRADIDPKHLDRSERADPGAQLEDVEALVDHPDVEQAAPVVGRFVDCEASVCGVPGPGAKEGD
jgi:hypothetical protein